MHDRYDLRRSSDQLNTTLMALGLLAWVLVMIAAWGLAFWMLSRTMGNG